MHKADALFAMIGCAAGLNAGVCAAEVRVVPGEVIYLNPTNPARNYSDLVIHNIVIASDAEESLEITGVEIMLSSGGHATLSKIIPVERLVAETREIGQMAAQGMGVLLHAQLLSADGLKGVFGREVSLAVSAQLAPSEALLTTRHHFSLDFQPDEAEIRVTGKTADGTSRNLSTRVPVHRYKSRISYSAPLEGTWLMTSLPSIQSHHRLNPPTEYALDFFSIGKGAEGPASNVYSLHAEEISGYGEPVNAAAGGEVVFVIADDVQDRAAMLPRDSESLTAAGQRISRYNMLRMAKDFRRAAAGNIVVIRHEAEGTVEYSSYGHLKTGSVRVAMGDRVSRGDVIAAVGDTGDSAAVHLHFQVNAGSDPFFSKSLPVRVTDFKPIIYGIDPGRIVSSGRRSVP
jgi:murein DD-endopeptidase MepM/ murein hydrolase activator NlpD